MARDFGVQVVRVHALNRILLHQAAEAVQQHVLDTALRDNGTRHGKAWDTKIQMYTKVGENPPPQNWVPHRYVYIGAQYVNVFKIPCGHQHEI